CVTDVVQESCECSVLGRGCAADFVGEYFVAISELLLLSLCSLICTTDSNVPNCLSTHLKYLPIQMCQKAILVLIVTACSRRHVRCVKGHTRFYIMNVLEVAHVGGSILWPESLYLSSATSKSYF